MKKVQNSQTSRLVTTNSLNLLAKGRKVIDKMSKPFNDSSRSISPSKSSQNKKMIIANIPQTEEYQKTTKLALTDRRKEQISKRSKIEIECYNNLQKRIKSEKYYIDTKKNPITKQFQRINHFDNLQVGNQIISEDTNVLSEIQNLKTRKFDISGIKKRLTDLPHLSEIQEMLKKQEKSKLLQKRKKILAGYKKLQQEEQVTPFFNRQTVKYQIYTTQDQLGWLNELHEAKEESYFNIINQKPKNIFLLLIDKNHKDFYSNRQILKRNYFDFYSNPSTQKQKNNHIDKISLFSREIICKPKTSYDSLPFSVDLKFDMINVQFHELMLIASGKLNKYNINKHIQQKEKEKRQIEQMQMNSQWRERRIAYSHNSKNRGDNYSPLNQGKIEVQYYKLLDYSKAERNQQDFSRSFRLKLKQLIKQEIFTNERTIFDRQVMKNLKEAMDNILVNMLDGDVEVKLHQMMKKNMSKKIRHNKSNKNRTETIKIAEISKALKMNKEFKCSYWDPVRKSSTLLNQKEL